MTDISGFSGKANILKILNVESVAASGSVDRAYSSAMTSHDPTAAPSEDTGVVAVVGTLNLDQVIRVDRLPADSETVLGLSQTERPGGKGANQALAAAGHARVALIGAVGDDTAAQTMLTHQRSAGVDVDHIHHAEGISGRAVIEVDAHGTNRIIVLSGANTDLPVDHTLTALDALDPDVVLTQLECPMAITEAVADWCRSHRRRFILNPSPVAPLDDSILTIADPVIVNEVEETYYGGPEKLGSTCRSVVITRGGAGVVVIDDAGEHHIEVRAVTATDTTGAGDVFAGVLAAHLAGGLDLLDAARHATSAATEFVERGPAAH